MLKLFFIVLIAGTTAFSQEKEKSKKSKRIENVVVEASCGQCRFGMKGDGCNLAVKIEGKIYWVDGSKIDDHGDAHAKDGLCNAVRKAGVSGKIVRGRFKASAFKLFLETELK
jgi:hypothetical protein